MLPMATVGLTPRSRSVGVMVTAVMKLLLITHQGEHSLPEVTPHGKVGQLSQSLGTNFTGSESSRREGLEGPQPREVDK